MTLLAARLLIPVEDRRDWGQLHLSYLSEALYGPAAAAPSSPPQPRRAS